MSQKYTFCEQIVTQTGNVCLCVYVYSSHAPTLWMCMCIASNLFAHCRHFKDKQNTERPSNRSFRFICEVNGVISSCVILLSSNIEFVCLSSRRRLQRWKQQRQRYIQTSFHQLYLFLVRHSFILNLCCMNFWRLICV